ncbi:hypothetical protein [Streptomyces zagrosensis]|uniref:Uncharacterized protein n=1 Tax=Streptomyces zagrosensis TaxID=1042984 RepID=A0A7W9UYX8_9ACTN|nr:hypothetical protein [Streptomyces zagrosensis]MBB5935821.1 hypothetical protein [Streptomyces zagrosensis]
MAAKGQAARLLFPRISPTETAAIAGDGRDLGADDSFGPGTEDRRPDVFQCAVAREARHAARRRGGR